MILGLFEARNKLYKIMQETIIVQQGRIETNDERFGLSKKDIPVKPPILKMQQLELGNSDLGETNFVVKKMTRATPQRVKSLSFSMYFRVKTLNTRNREKLQYRKCNKCFMRNPF